MNRLTSIASSIASSMPSTMTRGLLALLISSPATAGQLAVTIQNIESADGSLRIAIVADEAGFNGEAPAVMSVLMPPRGDKVTFSTDALVSGDYAVRVMHDENNNGSLDANLVGMPTEPWGFSNNAVGNFGPPGWNDARFSLDATTSITIDLNH